MKARPCPHCGHRTIEPQCERCGNTVTVSVGTDSLDALVQQASTPNLATLFRRAKDAGVIDANGADYGG